MEDGAIALERLGVELFTDRIHDNDHAPDMPPPSTITVGTNRILDVAALASQLPSLCGGCVDRSGACSIVQQPLPTTHAVIPQEKKLEVAHGKRKAYHIVELLVFSLDSRT